MRLRIDIEIPQKSKWMVSGIAIGIALGIGVSRVSAGEATVKNWVSGDTLTAVDLNSNFAILKAAIDQLQRRDCPTDYTRDTTVTNIVLCKKGPDEVVGVGVGGSTFWVDRYEASVWTTSYGRAGTQVGDNAEDTVAAGLPQNGQFTGQIGPVYALSVNGVLPTRYVTAFQAMEACAASGKQLPDGQQWMRAARGTSDGSGCNISGSAPRRTGQGTACASAWGAQDMIGNLLEPTTEWHAAVGADVVNTHIWTGSAYNDDATWNITSSAFDGTSMAEGLPVVAIRGGAWYNGTEAGIFALNLDVTPSDASYDLGFRCVIAR